MAITNLQLESPATPLLLTWPFIAIETWVSSPGASLVTVGCLIAKPAWSSAAALIVTLQGEAVPTQVPGSPLRPFQPVSSEPAAGSAFSSTSSPSEKSAEQNAPQEIPAGVLVTVPVPLPALRTLSLSWGAVRKANTSTFALPARVT